MYLSHLGEGNSKLVTPIFPFPPEYIPVRYIFLDTGK